MATADPVKDRVRSFVTHPLCLIVVLAWGAIRPILQSTIPYADDIAFHIQRLVQLSHLWQQGVYFTRWQPDLALGYGFPLFNFYAPLAYYLALPFHLIGFDAARALQFAFAIAVVGGGLGMFVFMRQLVSPHAGWLAAVAYMYAPYWQYDIYFRGNLAESVAWLWLPWLLWAGLRLNQTGARRWVSVVALLFAALILTHNMFALIFAPVLVGWLSLCAWQQAESLKRLIQSACATLLGAGIATFYWLPALTEQGTTALARFWQENPTYLIENNFLAVSELFAAPQIPYRDLINPSPVPTLGLLVALLAVVGLAAGVVNPQTRWASLFFALVACLFGLFTLPASAPLYRWVPLLQSLQFPWRMLGVAAFGAAILCGFVMRMVPNRAQTAVLMLAAFSLMTAHWQWRNPVLGNKIDPQSIADITEFEMLTGMLGTTIRAEFMPIAVEQTPEQARAAWFDVGDATILEEGVIRPNQANITLTTTQPQPLTFNQFYFAGWQATLNDQPIAIHPNQPYGLNTIDLPAGTHTVTFEFTQTPLRLFATVISVGALLLAVGLLMGRLQRAKSEQATTSPRLAAALVAISAVIFVLGGWLPARLNPDGTLAQVEHPSNQIWGGDIRLLGFEGPQMISAENPLDITLFLKADQPLSGDYLTTLALRDNNGVLWSAKTSGRVPRFQQPFATNAWPIDRYASIAHRVQLLSGTPPADYELVMTIFDRYTLAPLPLAGQTTTEVPLGMVRVLAPQTPLALAPRHPISQPDQPLLGYEVDRTTARPGDPMLLTLFWQGDAVISAENNPTLSLTNNDDRTAIPLDLPTLPPSGEWRTQTLLRLPAGLSSGEHQLSIGALSLGTLTVDAPERTFTEPSVDRPVGQSLGALATLVGVTVTGDGLALVWQGQQEMTQSYRVFVHALAADGTLLAQSDGEPAQWSRPTTGWLPNEFIVDNHLLDLINAAVVRIGFYVAEDGTRPAQPIEFDWSND